MAKRKQQGVLEVLDATARVPQHVVHRSFAHETVVLNLQTGRYHGLNPTAGTMLAELETGARIGDIAARLAGVYEQPVDELERDLAALCLDLLERGLIELTSTDGQAFEATASRDEG